MRHAKYRPGSLVLLRQLDANGQVATIWGGRVLTSDPKQITVLAIEMVYQAPEWHAVGDFQEVSAPPHKLPYKWDFPRLLVKFEANPTDLEARPVIEAALERFRLANPGADEA